MQDIITEQSHEISYNQPPHDQSTSIQHSEEPTLIIQHIQSTNIDQKVHKFKQYNRQKRSTNELRIDLIYQQKKQGNVMGVSENAAKNNLNRYSCDYKIKKYQKKITTIQSTNEKLKNLILGKKQKNIHQKRLSKIISRQLKVNKKQDLVEIYSPKNNKNKSLYSPTSMKAKELSILQDKDANNRKRYETEGNSSMLKILPESNLLKESPPTLKELIRQKISQNVIKKTRINRKFLISGSALNSIQHHVVQKFNDFRLKTKHPSAQKSKIISLEEKYEIQTLKVKPFKLQIDSISESPATKNFNYKKSVQLLLNKCFPQLNISQHVFFKIEEMFRFYHLVLLSFASKITCLKPQQLPKYHRKHIKLSYYTGSGNNRDLILQMMSKRWWWKQTSNIEEAQFVWTQHKVSKLFLVNGQNTEQQSLLDEKQAKDTTQHINYKKMLQNNRTLKYNTLIFKSFQFNQYKDQEPSLQKTIQAPKTYHNHFQGGNYLGDKKNLFNMLKLYFQTYKHINISNLPYLPQTYHIIHQESHSYKIFLESFQKGIADNTYWIVKPAQNSNRGRGIFLSNNLQEIHQAVVNRKELKGTTIIQKYLQDLLLFNGRKFDIRTYLLAISIGGNIKYYWFTQGYIRTSSYLYDIKKLNKLVHLTNDAIQNKDQSYGKYEKGNKINYQQLKTYLSDIYPQNNWKVEDLVNNMKKIAKEIASVSYPILNKSKQTGFQLFGMDFIIDNEFKPWLLQVNTNPCLQSSSPVLQKIIPSMLQNVVRLALDPLFPPNILPSRQYEYSLTDKVHQQNRFQLIFDSIFQKDKAWQNIFQTAEIFNPNKNQDQQTHEGP